jgi:hypothetical protein
MRLELPRMVNNSFRFLANCADWPSESQQGFANQSLVRRKNPETNGSNFTKILGEFVAKAERFFQCGGLKSARTRRVMSRAGKN